MAITLRCCLLALLSVALSLSVRAGEVIASVVDSTGKPVQDALVFIVGIFEKEFRADTAVMDQINKELIPHVLPVLVGTRVRFPNKDNIEHHLYSFSKTKDFELPLYKKREPPPILMDKVGVVKIGCNIHDWMLGYIIVLDNPYFKKTDGAGRAIIREIPSGNYKIALWSERLKDPIDGARQEVSIGKDPAHVQFRAELTPRRKSSRPAVIAY